jgi:LPXTG-site transpeptidase (sortase) family protein
MRYEYRRGIQKPKRWWVTLPVAGAIFAVYMAFNAFAPAIPLYASAPDETVKKLTASKPALNENRLFIPKINVNVATFPGEGTEIPSLANGAVHRSPQSGNPKDGGNYVIAAHRFQLGYTPQQTREKSPFYHLDKLGAGDEVYVDFDGVRYAFKITERKFVDPTDPAVEARTDRDRLTLYSSELTGPASTREIVVAEPVGTIVWINGAPKLKTL